MCLHLSRFDSRLRLVRLTPVEVVESIGDANVAALIAQARGGMIVQEDIEYVDPRD